MAQSNKTTMYRTVATTSRETSIINKINNKCRDSDNFFKMRFSCVQWNKATLQMSIKCRAFRGCLLKQPIK